MDRLQIERVGGLGGFGLPGSHLKSRGEVDLSKISPADRAAVDALFEKGGGTPPPKPDAFRYRITKQTPQGPQTVEVPEEQVPMVLQRSVKDVLE